MMLLDQSKKFKDNYVKSLQRENWDKYIIPTFDNFLKFKSKDNRNALVELFEKYFDNDDIKFLNKKFSKHEKIYLFHNLNKYENLHIFFQNVYSKFISDNNIFKKLIDYSIKNKFYKACFIINFKNGDNEKIKSSLNFYYEINGGLKIYCNFKD